MKKDHKHDWQLMRCLFPNVFEEDLVVYYVCEECERYKKVRFKKLKDD